VQVEQVVTAGQGTRQTVPSNVAGEMQEEQSVAILHKVQN